MAKFKFLAAAATLGVLAFNPAFAATPAGKASDIIQNFDGTLLDVMKQASSLGYDGRYQKLEPTIEQSFDVPFMTRIVVGSAWSTWTPQQQAQMTQAFGKFLAATYAQRFDGYGGENFVIDGSQDNQARVLVSTHLTRVGDTPVAINYLLRPDASGNQKIVDVLVTGSISELATRRSEFSSILANGGYDALLGVLEAKTRPAA